MSTHRSPSRWTPWLVATAILAAAVLLPLSASAQLYGEASESPRSHSVEIKFGPYTPKIGAGSAAYTAAFDDDAMFMTRLEYDYQFWQGFGSLAVGGEVGYGTISGFGLAADEGTPTSDETAMNVVPMSVSLVYHLDVLATRWNVPLVPYVKAGFDLYVWWITNGLGETAVYTPDGGEKEFKAAGTTIGWHVQAGLKILLDFLAPQMAQTFDNEIGVNNSYIFVEMLYADVDDFGSDTSWQLGDLTWMIGLAFEF